MNSVHPVLPTGLAVCIGLLLAGAQAPTPQSAAPQAASVQGPATPVPVNGVLPELPKLSLLDALQAMREQTTAEDLEGAKRTGEMVLVARSFDAWRGSLDLDDESWWNPVIDRVEPLAETLKLSFTREEKAHVHYALGVVALAAEDAKRAQREFGKATAQAGHGDLRKAASYNVSTMALMAGESWRAQMPEFGGQPPVPAMPAPTAPGAPNAAPAQPEEPPDPLEQARAAYLAAKEGYVQRLQLDWRDADTRANMELVMRRLHELDEIERQREEQKQEEEQQDDEKKDQESEDKDSEKDKQDKQDKQDPSDEKDDQESDKDKQDSDSQEPEQPEEPKPEEEQPEEEQDAPNEEESEEQQQEEQQQAPPQEERYLTKEEIQRLLERLKEHEELGRELRERRRQTRRPTARDW